MSDITSQFIPWCREAGFDLITGVPDGYLVPLITQAENSDIPYIPAAREEECFGIASGASMAGKKVLVMMQNAGFLNSIGCFATLCVNYRVPMVILVSHRGNIFDQNAYDTEKYRYYENFTRHAPVFSLSVQEFQEEGNLFLKALARAEASLEPSIINLDRPPGQAGKC